MKEEIVGVMSYPYMDKLAIQVYRQLDRFHVATSRIYTAYYSNPNKARKLMQNFLDLNALVQAKIIEQRIERWKIERDS